MSNDEILELAKEDRVYWEYEEFGWQECDRYKFNANELIAFAQAIAQRTREECAAVCDELAANWKEGAERDYTQDDLCAELCAEAIRSVK